jgi:GTP-binding protein EngB required for normal cell division
MPDKSNSLNSNHERRLGVTCRHIDKLLADIETSLNISASKLAFPHYASDLSPAQRRVIEAYISRIRAQLVRVLDGQRIERPPADIPVSRALHANLAFIDIAAEELKPEYMRGCGEVPSVAAVELNGIAAELQGLVRQLDRYVMRGPSQDLQQRLEKLERSGKAGSDVALLKKLESVVSEHGLVEFRSAISMILDRLEDHSFEIAIFGRVSSGKSSLLNAILETDVLPVGVTPITAVPTRLVHGDTPALHVWFANRTPERFEIAKLPELVAEPLNPGNKKHVTRIVVQLPSPRLGDGIAFVDTPGLGSLAARGAAETLAYLPRCDLGVVLIDAGSTLTPDDVKTIQTLYEAAIPANVLLSKADLLTANDRSRVIDYVKSHIKDELNLDLSVHAVSVRAEAESLWTQWFEQDIAPLYTERQELKARSIRRKLGSLQQSVESALRSELRRKDSISPQRIEQLRVVETELRQASGRLEEMKKAARNMANELEYSGAAIIRLTAATVVEAWSKQGASDDAIPAIVRRAVTGAVQEKIDTLRKRLDVLAHQLYDTLQAAATVIEIEDVPGRQEFSGTLREMPAFAPGQLAVPLNQPFLSTVLGTRVLASITSKRLTGMIGGQLSNSLAAYHALLYDWSERTLTQIQRRFDAYANNYRAQIERLVGDHSPPSGRHQQITRDLEILEKAKPESSIAS